MYVIYGLEDPRDRMYHYVGITDDVYARFNQHITGSSGNIEKNGWIWECRQGNIMIVMRELERVETVEDALSRERFWITYYLNIGHPLRNVSVAKSIMRQREDLERKYNALMQKELSLKTVGSKLQVKRAALLSATLDEGLKKKASDEEHLAYQRFVELKNDGLNKKEIILAIWEAQAGASQTYRMASTLYDAFLKLYDETKPGYEEPASTVQEELRNTPAYRRFETLKRAGKTNKKEIILSVWGEKAGASQGYQKASALYEQFQEIYNEQLTVDAEAVTIESEM